MRPDDPLVSLPATPQSFRFDATGTQWSIDTAEPLDDDMRAAILSAIDSFDRTWSRFRPDSLVARIAGAEQGGRFSFPPQAERLFALYDSLHKATEGAVDPLVGRDLELLGYDPGYTLTPVACGARTPISWLRDIRHEAGWLTTRRAETVDVGAAGKGLLVDIVAMLLDRAGHDRHVVDAGGDMRHRGPDHLRIGLEHPAAPGQVIGIAELSGRALCASATSRRRWGNNLHHVIDARTGAPTRDVVATWVIADDAMIADGLATALFFTGHCSLADLAPFEFVRMFADGRAERSANIPGELFEG